MSTEAPDALRDLAAIRARLSHPSGSFDKAAVTTLGRQAVRHGSDEDIARLVQAIVGDEDACIALTTLTAKRMTFPKRDKPDRLAILLRLLVEAIVARYSLESEVGQHLARLYTSTQARYLTPARGRSARKRRPVVPFSLFRSCFESHPNFLSWSAYELKAQGKLEEAVALFREIPDPTPEITFEIADALERLGKDAEAVKLYERVRKRIDATKLIDKLSRHMSDGFAAKLRMGDFAGGWAQLQKRRDRATLVLPPGVKMWDGSPISGETLLVLAEGGVGDEIKLASLFPDLMERTKAACVTIDPRLEPLMRRSFQGLSFIPVMRQARTKPKGFVKLSKSRTTGLPLCRSMPAEIYCLAQFCDNVVLSGDLLTFWRPGRHSFPRHRGYLVPDRVRRSGLRQRLDALGPGLKVGIAWRSEMCTIRREQFYFDLGDLGPILSVPGVAFVNLQYDDCARELTDARTQLGTEITDFHDLDLREDLETFAALIAELDVVVAPYTMIKEMSGAVGTPTLLMNPSLAAWADWRRDPKTGEDVYHPCVLHIVPERSGDKTAVIEKTAAKLRELVEGGEGGRPRWRSSTATASARDLLRTY